MKRLAAGFLIAGALFALAQCELFSKTVEYAVTAGFGNVTVLYNDENGEGNAVTTAIPWSVSFDLFSSKRPFAAALRVTNNTGGTVDACIREEGVNVDEVTGLAAGSTADLWAWIE